MNLGSIIPKSSAGNERRDIASGLRRLNKMKPNTAPQSEDQEWMTTYTDLVTLLLTLFVILISMATFQPPGPVPDQKEPEKQGPEQDIPPPPNSVFEFYRPGLGPNEINEEQDPYDSQIVRKWSDRVEAILRHYLSASKFGEQLEIEKVEGQVLIHLSDRVLFSSASSTLGTDGESVLHEIAPVLRYLEIPIFVEGHTDSLPINSPIFPSNWELSSARAAAVVRRLIDEGIRGERLVVVGHGDTRPRAGNDTASGRATNRRVSLVLRSLKDGSQTGAGGRNR